MRLKKINNNFTVVPSMKETFTESANFFFWISLNHDLFKPNSFIWESTGEFAEFYTNWIGGKPNPPAETTTAAFWSYLISIESGPMNGAL